MCAFDQATQGQGCISVGERRWDRIGLRLLGEVAEVPSSVGDLEEGEGRGAASAVAAVEEEGSQGRPLCHEDPAPEVELETPGREKRPLDVLLHHSPRTRA